MYMSPEQLKGGDPDTRTDQFSWGVMTYEVLTGERPWPEKSDLLAAVATILTEDPKSLRKHSPELPHAIETVVARTLARNPNDRFESMDDIAELLEPLAVRSGPTRSSATGGASTARPRTTTPADDKSDEPKSTRQAMVTAKSPEHPLAPPPQQPRETRRRWPFIAGVLVTLLASGAYYKYRKPTVVVTPPTNGTSSVPTTTSSSSVGAPPPTENAEALAAYEEGVQQWRDGSSSRSHTSLEHAIKADAGFAAAYLELALQALLAHEGMSRAQEYYQKAYSHRDRLSPRDRALLDAVDPIVRASGDTAAETRLKSAAARFTQEPIFELMLGYVRETRADYEQARLDYELAIARDPAFMPALLAEGHVLLQLGRPDLALEAYGRCIVASSAAAICLEQRMLLLRDRGECDPMEQDARAWQAVEPEAPEPSYYVAAALMARGAPLQSVEIALRRQWEAMAKDQRPAGEAEDTANLALAQGDFETAERATAAWDAACTKQEVLVHSGPQQQLAYIAYETGDVDKAARIADAFLKILPALTPGPNNADPTMWTEEYLYRTHKVTKADLDEKRKAWLKDREANRTQQENRRLAPFRWAQLYAAFAENLDEAREALDKLPEFLPLPPESRHTAAFDAELGKTYALAGKYDDALPPLRAVTKACIALGSPIPQTRSFYFLGMALEGKGDIEGARKAYHTVLDRWGGHEGKLKSRTVEEAKKRLKVLE